MKYVESESPFGGMMFTMVPETKEEKEETFIHFPLRSLRALLSKKQSAGLYQNLFHQFAMHIGQAVVAALEMEREAFVINP